MSKQYLHKVWQCPQCSSEPLNLVTTSPKAWVEDGQLVTCEVHGPQRARVILDPDAQGKFDPSAAGGGCLLTMCAVVLAGVVLLASLGLTV